MKAQCNPHKAVRIDISQIQRRLTWLCQQERACAAITGDDLIERILFLEGTPDLDN